jgi:hypothetical protein
MVAMLLGVAACGTTSAQSAASAASTTQSTPRARSATTTTPTLTVPPGAVAIVAGTPITRAQFNHWERVAAKGQAAQSPGQPAIIPTDPPRFTNCVAAERKANPSFADRPVAALKSICSELFKTLSDQVLEFLIKADWIRAEAAREGVTPGAAKVDAALNTDKRQTFPTPGSYQAFLRKTGQTDADVRFRLAVQLALTALTRRQPGSENTRAAAIDKKLTRMFRPQTVCAAQYVMRDCSNYRAPAP